jgi:hypothetical protein
MSEPKVGQLWRDRHRQWYFLIRKVSDKSEGFVEKVAPDISVRHEEWVYWDNIELGMSGNASKVWFLRNCELVSG